MRHSRAILLSTAYDLGELSTARRSRLQRHLDRCAACAAAAQKARQFNQFLGAAAFEPPMGFEGAVESVRQRSLRAAREQSSEARSFWAPMRRPAVLAMGLPAMAGAVVVAVVLARGGNVSQGSRTDRVSLPAAVVPSPVDASSPAAPVVAQAAPLASSVAHSRRAPEASAVAENVGFVMVRSGLDVKIEWPSDRGPHRVRKGENPATVQLAGRQVVRGRTWSDPEVQPEAGRVTFYLVD